MKKKDRVEDLVKFAGNYEVPGKTFLSINRLDYNKDLDHLLEVSKTDFLKNGDIVTSFPDKNSPQPNIILSGHVRNKGIYPFNKYKTLSKLIFSDSIFYDDTYRFSIIVERFNKDSQRKEYLIKNLNNPKRLNITPIYGSPPGGRTGGQADTFDIGSKA